MRYFTLIIFTFIGFYAHSQYYYHSSFLSEIPFSLSETLEKQDSAFSIERYLKTYEKDDSAVLVEGIYITKIDSVIFQTELYNNRSFRKKYAYWKLDSNKFIQRCTKKGKVKAQWVNHNFFYYDITINDKDSIVNSIYKTVYRRDTSCHALYKYIYRNGVLKERWDSYVGFDKCNWEEYDNISIKKYTNYNLDTIIINEFRGHIDSLILARTYKTLSKYDSNGNILEHYYYSNINDIIPISHDIYFYNKKGRYKWEYWNKDGLSEYYIIKN